MTIRDSIVSVVLGHIRFLRHSAITIHVGTLKRTRIYNVVYYDDVVICKFRHGSSSAVGRG